MRRGHKVMFTAEALADIAKYALPEPHHREVGEVITCGHDDIARVSFPSMQLCLVHEDNLKVIA